MDRPDKASIQTFYKSSWYSYFGILLIRLLKLNHSEICLFWDHTAVVSQINSADVWHAGYSEYLLILTRQLWNCHSPETDGEANICGLFKRKQTQAWAVWLGLFPINRARAVYEHQIFFQCTHRTDRQQVKRSYLLIFEVKIRIADCTFHYIVHCNVDVFLQTLTRVF